MTHQRIRPASVVRVLDTLLESRWAKAVQPPLDKGVVNLPPEAPWHPGAIEFRDRDQPWITSESVGVLSNTLQIVLPFCGGVLFLRGWLRKRTAAGRERRFDQLLARVSEVEHHGVALSRAGAIDREAIDRLERELSDIKDQALAHIAGTEADTASLAAILMADIRDVRTLFANLQEFGAPETSNGRTDDLKARDQEKPGKRDS